MAFNNSHQGELEEVLIPIHTGSHINGNDTTNTPDKSPPGSPLRRRAFKGKTRRGESSVPLSSHSWGNVGSAVRGVGVFGRKTEKKNIKKADGPDEMEIYKKITSQLNTRNRRRMTLKIILEIVVFLVILTCLICSLTVKKLENTLFLGVEDWKWFVIAMVIFSGMLITQWIVHLIVVFIEWKFLLKKNVVYFTHALQNNIVAFIWISVVLGTWCLLVRPDLSTHKAKDVLDVITVTLITLLICSFLWLMKTILIKTLASSFHLNRFFDRIQESVFHHYVLQTLSGSPSAELTEILSRQDSSSSSDDEASTSKEKKVVDWAKLHKLKAEKVPSWTMKVLVDMVSDTGLSTISSMLDENEVEGGVELDDDEITNEEVAIATAVKIFNNIIKDKVDEPYIKKEDLNRYMIQEEVNIVSRCLEFNENGQADVKAFIKWVVQVHKDRQSLRHALNDNKTAVDDLDRIVIGFLIIVSIILWLLLTQIVSSQVLLFLSSQLLVAAFIFGNTAKTIFEAIIFVFVMHPYDIGDRCFIDGTMMVVEEMNILTTVFLKPDNEKVYYPNSSLATKPISNFFRSPDQSDTFDFTIDYRTPLSKIDQLKERIKQYVEGKPEHFHPSPSLLAKEIKDMNSIKMLLIFRHKMNFQDNSQRNKRKSDLVLQLKNIFDSLEITYHLLPQEVILDNSAK